MRTHLLPGRIGVIAATVLLTVAVFLFVDVSPEFRGGLLAIASVAAVGLYVALYMLQRRRHW